MGRLIDAAEFTESLVDQYCEDCSKCNGSCRHDELMKLVDAQPIAYDIDKVVEQLEELTSEECTLHECGIRSERCKPCIAKKAIKIVKAGGIHEKADT